MDISNIFIIAASLGNLLLGLFVLFKNPYKRQNQLLASLAICLAVWSAILFWASSITDTSKIAFLAKINFMVMTFAPYLILNFILVFPIKEIIQKWFKYIIIFPVLIFIILIPTDLFIKEAVCTGMRFELHRGIVHKLWVIYFLVYLLIAFKHLLLKYKRAEGIFKLQIKYVLFGIYVCGLAAVTTNLILPVMGINHLIKAGPPATIIFIGFSSYAIVKHRLLDIDVIIKRSVVYAGMTVFITGSYVFVLFVSNRYFSKGSDIFSLVTIIFTSLVIAYTMQPLRNKLDRITDKIFFKGKYDYHKTLRDLSYTISSVIRLDELIQKVLFQEPIE